MAQWHRKLYIGEKASLFEKEIKTVVDKSLAFPEAYLITLAANPAEQLDIISTAQLVSWKVYRTLPVIVGIAITKKEALGLVRQMAENVYRETGQCNLREFFS